MEILKEFLKNWNFHVPTAVVTIVLAPLGVFLLKILLEHLKKLGSYILEGLKGGCIG